MHSTRRHFDAVEWNSRPASLIAVRGAIGEEGVVHDEGLTSRPVHDRPIRRRTWLASLPGALALCALDRPAQAATAPATPGQPRLGATPQDWATLEERRKADPDLDRLVVALLERARKDLPLAPLERKLEGIRLLWVSREFIRRGLQWAFAYRLTGEAVFLDRARREMLAVSAFSDWHPAHFLDVAELTAGMAMTYDWLQADLSPDEQAQVRKALVDLGIAQARRGHKTFRVENNWAQVCLGGMVLGALAVEPDQPGLASDLLYAARRDVAFGLEAYRPDGVYPEGPGYWDYGTTYSVLLVAALRAAKGTDWGVLGAPGFRRSAEFYAHAIGPSGKAFNFADGGEGPGFSCALVYLARELEQPALLSPMRQMIRNRQGLSERFATLSALWWPPAAASKPSPTAFFGQGKQPVAIWRGSWQDPNTLWFAIKGGGAAHNHAHMDAGSFVLDMDGVRWAKDLGMQEYNSLESKGIDLWNMRPNSARWQVFRLSAQAHNTLTCNAQPHHASGMAILRVTGEQEALVDLTPALLPGQVRQATRRVRFLDESVLMDDEIQGAKPETSIRWAMNTEAQVQIEGKVATLSQKGKRLVVQFEGSDLRLDVLDISAPVRAYDVPNPNVRQLIVTGKTASDGSWKLQTRFARG